MTIAQQSDPTLNALRAHARRLVAERQWVAARVDQATWNLAAAEHLARRWPGTLRAEFDEEQAAGARAYLEQRQRELQDHDAAIATAQLAVAARASERTTTQETETC